MLIMNSLVSSKSIESESVTPKNDRNQGIIESNVQNLTNSLKNEIITRPLTSVDRLYHRRKSRVSKLIEKTSIPKDLLEQLKIANNEVSSLTSLIPVFNFPNHKIVLSRGKISKPIINENVSNATQGSPVIKKSDVGKYCALHDPHTKSFFKKPSIREHLVEQGLVTEDGHVVCNILEFNNWRQSLGNGPYNEIISDSFDQMMKITLANHAQLQKLQAWSETESFSKLEQSRREHQQEAYKRRKQKEKSMLQKHKENEQKKIDRMKRFRFASARESYDRAIKASTKDYHRNLTVCNNRKQQLMARNRLISKIVEKQKMAEQKIQLKKDEQLSAAYRQCLKNFHTHVLVRKIEKERDEYVASEMERELRNSTIARIDAVEKHRDTFALTSRIAANEAQLCQKDTNKENLKAKEPKLLKILSSNENITSFDLKNEMKMFLNIFGIDASKLNQLMKHSKQGENDLDLPDTSSVQSSKSHCLESQTGNEIPSSSVKSIHNAPTPSSKAVSAQNSKKATVNAAGDSFTTKYGHIDELKDYASCTSSWSEDSSVKDSENEVTQPSAFYEYSGRSKVTQKIRKLKMSRFQKPSGDCK